MSPRAQLCTWVLLLGLGFVSCSSENGEPGGREVTGTGAGGGAPKLPPPGPHGGIATGTLAPTGQGGASGVGGSDHFGGGGGGGGGPDCVATDLTSLTVSADDSNSMGSPVYAREMLASGKAPDPALIRTYEFLNYYSSGYPAAPDGALSIAMSLAPGDLKVGEPYRLQIGVSSPPPPMARPVMSLTIVVDTSQSMAGHALQNARAVVSDIAGSLKVADRVSLVTLDAEATPLVDGAVIPANGDVSAVTAKLEMLKAGGSPDLQGGLVRAYALAYKYVQNGGLNRVVLITDGRTNPASIDMGFVDEHAKKGDEDGILLVGVATGPADGYNDSLLNQMTDAGRGAYVFIDTPLESKALFSARFSEVMEIAARGVQVRATLPGYLRLQQYYGEQASSTDAGSVEPQHLAPGDAMIFNMVLNSSCASPLLNEADPIAVHVDWIDPITLKPRFVDASLPINALLAKGAATQMVKSNAIIAYAEALKSNDATRLKLAAAEVAKALVVFPGDEPDLIEIQGLLAKHPLLAGP